MGPRLDVDEIGEERLSAEDETLDRNVGLLVRVVDPGDWNVAAALDKGREDEPAEVVPDLSLDGEGAAFVKEQVLGEPLDVGSEPGIQWVCEGTMIRRSGAGSEDGGCGRCTFAEALEPVLHLVE